MLRSVRTTILGAAAVAVVAVTTPALALSAHAVTSAVTPSTVTTASSAAVYGAGPYRPTDSVAAGMAKSLASSDPAGAAAASVIAQYPVATWLGDWTTGSSLVATLKAQTAGAAASGTTAVFVTYAIPDRDCGGYSSGGMDENTYDAWVDTIASTLAGTRSAVIVEPDSLAMLSSCTSPDLAAQRYRILSREAQAFTNAGVAAYLDAGNSNWNSAAVTASRLQQAGVASARGFFSNVSNFNPTANEQAYDQKVSSLLGGAHYVIDTSRNGQGWKGTWCNGPGAGLGSTPRVMNDGTALDALLWVKTPGASDGNCTSDAPAAGVWWSAYAQALVANAVLNLPTAAPAAPAVPVSPVVPGSGTSPSATPSATPTATATPTPVPTPMPVTTPTYATMTSGATVSSPNGQYQVTMQSDGNLVEYGNGHALRATGTSGHPGAVLRMSSTGGASVVSATGQTLWDAGSTGNGTPTLVVTNSGDLRFTIGTGVVWSSGTSGSDRGTASAVLRAGQYLTSDNGTFQLVMQSDGNVVLYRGSAPIWWTGTSGASGAWLTIQADGNVVLYSAKGWPLWWSGTSGAGNGVQFVAQSDGNLVLYSGGTPVWHR